MRLPLSTFAQSKYQDQIRPFRSIHIRTSLYLLLTITQPHWWNDHTLQWKDYYELSYQTVSEIECISDLLMCLFSSLGKGAHDCSRLIWKSPSGKMNPTFCFLHSCIWTIQLLCVTGYRESGAFLKAHIQTSCTATHERCTLYMKVAHGMCMYLHGTYHNSGPFLTYDFVNLDSQYNVYTGCLFPMPCWS